MIDQLGHDGLKSRAMGTWQYSDERISCIVRCIDDTGCRLLIDRR
jgi:hypothetical protein